MPNFHSTKILGDLKVTGDIISTAPQGESPLIVQSTTTVSNFSADLLDGKHGSHYENIGNLTGTISATVLANSTLYVGTTAIALNRASAGMSLTGVSIDGTSTGVVRTVTGTGQAELVRGNMGDNDHARISIGATAANAGFLEISTADDGTEPIYVRQYTGTFTTLTRTATLLDASGNTAFPNELSSKTLSLSLPDGGDAPMTVASKVMVNNLNVQYLDGKLSTDFYPSSNPDGFTPNEGTVTSITAGNGMNFDAISTTGAVTLGTPSTLTSSTTNSVTSTSHTHEITTYNLSGTSNQITVTGAAKVLGAATTLSLPQNIHTGATPLFSSMSLKKGMTNGDTAAFTNPHLALVPNSNVDLTGFVGMTMATSTTANYGYSLGAKRTTNGNGNFVIRSHQENATGNEVFRLNVSGDLNIPGSFNANNIIAAGDVVVDGGDIKQTAKTGTNVEGSSLSISSGQGTGSGTPTSIKFKTPSTTAVATDTQPLLDRMTISADGVTVHGDFRVDGTTKTINSTVVTIDDPVLTLGGDTAPTSNDGKDRGIEYRWHDGTSAKLGFFGLDRSIQRFTYIPDASNASEVFSGNLGIARFNSLELMTSGTNYGTISTSALNSNQTYILPNLSGTVALTSNLHNRSHTMTSTSDHTAGNWKAFYSNGSGQVVELALGTAGHYLRSGGAAAAPTFAKIAYSEISGTPSISISAGATDGIFDITGTGGTNSVSYAVAPYAAKTVGGFDKGAVNPDGTTRINWNGYLYGTKLYSGGHEVYTSDNLPTYPEVNDGALALAVSSTAGATNTTITIETGTGFTANEPAGTVTYKHRVGPALTALATTMTGATSGFLKKTSQDTYILDTNTYLTSFTESDTLHSVTSRGNTTTNNLSIGALTLTGSLTSGAGPTYSNYVAGADNIILKGNAAGVSGLFFESEKDGTSINHPSDYAFIQYHPYGIGGSTGESGRLVIGISNDATTDKLVLNPPGATDLVVRLGAATTEYQVWHAGNDGSSSGLDADLLDGNHASAFYLATNPGGYTTNEGTVTSVAAGNGMNFTTITDTGSVTMGTPSTLTNATTNAVTATSHTHAITTYAVSGTTNQITVSGSPKLLGSATTLSLPQNIHTGATPTFARLSLSQPMTSGTTAAFTNPHLALVPTDTIDNTGFVGMTFATSTAANYGFSLGALRSTDGSGSIVIRNHSNNATGTEIFRLDAAGNLTIPGKMIVSETEVSSTSNGVLFEGSVADDFEGLLKAGTLTDDRTYILPDLSGTVALTSQINDASLTLTASAGATNTAVTIGTGTGFTANDATNTTYDIDVGPALTNLATTMTGAGTGFIRKNGQDTYTLDTNTYLTSFTESDTLQSVTSRGSTTTSSITVGGITTGGLINFNTASTSNGFLWNVNSDLAGINFKNTGDGDTNSYLNFFTKDNGNEYMKFSHQHYLDGNKDFMDIKDGAIRVNGDIYVNATQSGDFATGTNTLINGNKVATESFVNSQYDFKTITVTDTDSGHTWAGTGSAVSDTTGDTLTIVSGSGIDVDVSATTDAIRITNSDKGSSQNIFKNFTDGTTTSVADSNNDTFKFRGSGGVTVAVQNDDATHGDNLLISWLHPDTSSQGSVNNSNGTVIQDITLDDAGHVTAIGSYDLDNRYAPVVNLTVTTAAATAAKVTTETVTFADNTIYMVRFTLGNTVSNPTLNGVNIRIGTTNASTTTFNFSGEAIVPLVYDETLNKLQITGSYRTSDGTESYTVRWNAAVKAGVEITRYKLLVQGEDNKYYPTTIGNTDGNTKTVSTVPFLIGAPILFYNTTTTVAADVNTGTTSNYTGILTSSTARTWNQNSGWRAQEDVYLKGTISGSFFTLDNTTTTSHMTQDLPTTDDGFYYLRLGMMTDTTTGFKLSVEHPIYYFANGELQLLAQQANAVKTYQKADNVNYNIPFVLDLTDDEFKRLYTDNSAHLTYNPSTNTLSTTTFNGSLVNSVSGTGSLELVRGNMADNDHFRILVGGTAANAGYAEIATADDGNEPIYVRQYTGVFSNLQRTLTLLDGSGNTSIPGSLTIAGNLTINGTTTTINTETLNVSDNIIVLNNDVTGTPTENAGIEVERGTSASTSIRWNETSDRWEFTNNGTNYHNIPLNTEYNNYTHPDYSLTQAAGTKTTLTGVTLIDSLTTNSTGHLTGATWRKLVAGSNVTITPASNGDITIASSFTDTNTASAVDNILDGSNSGTAITYAPYSAQQAKLSFDTSTTNPARTDRLNLNGYLYASRLHSLGIYGGNLASGNLTIGSTSHATKGSVSIDSNTAIAGSVTVGSTTVNGTNSGTMQYNSTTKSIEFIFS